jgi:hypothetical protein
MGTDAKEMEMEMKTRATAEYYPVIVEQESNGTWSAD